MLILWHWQEIYYVVNLIFFFFRHYYKVLELNDIAVEDKQLINLFMFKMWPESNKTKMETCPEIWTESLPDLQCSNLHTECSWKSKICKYNPGLQKVANGAECHSQKCLDCANICQHKHNKTKEYMLISADLRIFLESLDFVEIL